MPWSAILLAKGIPGTDWGDDMQEAGSAAAALTARATSAEDQVAALEGRLEDLSDALKVSSELGLRCSPW